MDLLVATKEHNSEPSLCRLQQRRDTTRPDDSNKEKNREKEEQELQVIDKGGEEVSVVARKPIYSPLDPVFESLYLIRPEDKWLYSLPPCKERLGLLAPIEVPPTTVDPSVASTGPLVLPSEPDDMAEEEYYDKAYDALEEGGLADDGYSYLLTHVIGLNEDVRRLLYSSGINSMDAMVECFPTHSMVNEFIESIAKRDSKSVTIIVYREEERQPVECHLQFPLLQHN
jgi:hypothetical protein